MKIIGLLVMMLSVGVAQAKVYKCPGKIEGQYIYQEKPCKGAKPDEHTIKIVPADEKKIADAQAKLAKEIEAGKEKKEQPTVLLTVPTSATPAAGNVQPATNNSTATVPAANPGVSTPTSVTPPPAPTTPTPAANPAR